MTLFPWQKTKQFFTPEENERIAAAIRKAEQQTSGEVRVFVEGRCRYVDAIDRAVEIFQNLKMQETKDRNAVLIYVAIKDRQLAIFGDEGIHLKCGNVFWSTEVLKMIKEFNRENYAEGITRCVLEVGEALKTNFPYDKDTDKNELPDEIVFGR
jgi:uncharacterized membrane protein